MVLTPAFQHCCICVQRQKAQNAVSLLMYAWPTIMSHMQVRSAHVSIMIYNHRQALTVAMVMVMVI